MRSACSLRVVTANSRVGKDCFDGGEIVINFANGFFMTGYGSLNIANDSVSIYSIIYTIVSKESW